MLQRQHSLKNQWIREITLLSLSSAFRHSAGLRSTNAACVWSPLCCKGHVGRWGKDLFVFAFLSLKLLHSLGSRNSIHSLLKKIKCCRQEASAQLPGFPWSECCQCYAEGETYSVSCLLNNPLEINEHAALYFSSKIEITKNLKNSLPESVSLQ